MEATSTATSTGTFTARLERLPFLSQFAKHSTRTCVLETDARIYIYLELP